MKKRSRRRKLRELILNSPKPWLFTQMELAKILGVSQSTINRDLLILGRSRWNPYKILELKMRSARANLSELTCSLRIYKFTYFLIKKEK